MPYPLYVSDFRTDERHVDSGSPGCCEVTRIPAVTTGLDVVVEILVCKGEAPADLKSRGDSIGEEQTE